MGTCSGNVLKVMERYSRLRGSGKDRAALFFSHLGKALSYHTPYMGGPFNNLISLLFHLLVHSAVSFLTGSIDI